MKSFLTSGVTTCICLDTRKPLKDGSFPVKVRVTYKRTSRYYATKYSLAEEDYSKVMGEKPRGEYKEMRKLFDKIDEKAVEVIKKLNPFTFDSFKIGFFDKSSYSDDVFGLFEAYISELRTEERVNTAISYECTLASLKKYHVKSLLTFEEVTSKFLNQYESWMLSEGNTLTTVGIYLRSLRSIFNKAVDKGLARRELYPFGTNSGKYRIPTPRNVKKALIIEDIKKLFLYQPEPGSGEEMYRDLWKFSYLCNGINVKDICLLFLYNYQIKPYRAAAR